MRRKDGQGEMKSIENKGKRKKDVREVKGD